MAEESQNRFNVATLSGGYMLTSLVGGIISAFYVYPSSVQWGFTLLLFFFLMLVASFISMTYAPAKWPLENKKTKKKTKKR
jgi:multisubunit Na+/H+ antiporter MnhE subunit